MSDNVIRDAIVATMAWTAEPAAYIRWCPGDTTQYRVHLIQAEPSVATPDYQGRYEALLVRVEDRAVVVLRLPHGNGWSYRYTALEWLRAGLPAGMWAGIRPLLAALNWAEGPTSYRRADAIKIGRLEQRANH